PITLTKRWTTQRRTSRRCLGEAVVRIPNRSAFVDQACHQEAEMRSIMWDRARPRRGFRRVRAAIPLGIAALVGLPLVLAGGKPSVGSAAPDVAVFHGRSLVLL